MWSSIKEWHMNIINVGQNIFECHDIIPNEDLRNMRVVCSNMYHKVIIEQCKISNQDFSLVPSELEIFKITLEIMSNMCSRSTFAMRWYLSLQDPRTTLNIAQHLTSRNLITRNKTQTFYYEVILEHNNSIINAKA
jgi:hypothetical protein